MAHFRSLVWVLLAFSAAVHAQGLRRAPFRGDAKANGTTSVSVSPSSSPASASVLPSSSPPPPPSTSSSSQTSSSTIIQSTPSSSPPPLPSSSPSSSTFLPSSSSTSATTASSQSLSLSSISSSLPSSSFASTSAQPTVSVPKGAVIKSPAASTQTPTTNTNNVAANPTDTDTQPSSSSSGSSDNVDAASSGFWGNKGEVGATFAVVALVVVGVLVGLVLIIRRRSAAHNSARDTFFDTKGPMDRAERGPSPEPSMHSLGNEPMDAHATPSPNYGHTDQYLVNTADYNIYPPGAAYAPATDPAATDQQYYYADNMQQQHYTDNAQQQYYPDNTEQQYYLEQQQPADQLHPAAAAHYAEGSAYESYNQHYGATTDTGNGYNVSPANQRPSLSPHPYSHPSHASGVSPSTFARDIAGRDSYQQSIDSFYGAAGTAH